VTPEYNLYTAMDRQDIARPGASEALRNAIETLIQARIASKQQINGNMAIHFIDQAIDTIRGSMEKSGTETMMRDDKTTILDALHESIARSIREVKQVEHNLWAKYTQDQIRETCPKQH